MLKSMYFTRGIHHPLVDKGLADVYRAPPSRSAVGPPSESPRPAEARSRVHRAVGPGGPWSGIDGLRDSLVSVDEDDVARADSALQPALVFEDERRYSRRDPRNLAHAPLGQNLTGDRTPPICSRDARGTARKVPDG